MPLKTAPPYFHKSLITLAVTSIFLPNGAQALDLTQIPPLPVLKSSFVAPNVIISIDDSGSMGFCIKEKSTGPDKCTLNNNNYPVIGASDREIPELINGKKIWPANSRRMNVLKYALKEVFNDRGLIPPNEIRLGWQVMHNNGTAVENYSSLDYWYGGNKANPGKGKTNYAANISSTQSSGKHYIRSLDDTHRTNFLEFVDYLLPKDGTPSHKMFSQADEYMRDKPLDKDSPWASIPGSVGEPFLGCRRNYHIMMTDGRWNGTATGGSQDDIPWSALGKRKAYDITSDQTKIYSDIYPNTLADWAFKSWMDPLKTSGLTGVDKIQTPKSYQDADNFEKFEKTNTVSYKNGECNKWKNNGKCDGYVQIPVTETKSVNLQKYWNPKYNPATWPHMVTYTIGFSEEAVNWPGATEIIAPPEEKRVPFGFENGFIDLITGWQNWPKMDAENKRSLDLWHAAINGRGRYYAVTDPDDLAKAFREIIGKINEDSTGLPDTVGAGSASSGFNTTHSNTGNYASAYNAKASWKGWINASASKEPVEKPCPNDPEKICIDYPDPTKGWEGKTTADRLDALTDLDDRVILSWSDEEQDNKKIKGGVAFKWANDQTNLSTAQKELLGKEDNATATTIGNKGKNILNYIRGEHTYEGNNTTPNGYTDLKPFRERKSRQGDIINSEIWFTGAPANNYSLPGYIEFIKAKKDRTPILYVGGNDGMLHGFSTIDGKEKIAYVPRGIISSLKKLTSQDYNHQYFVDGSPMTGDVTIDSKWHTMLVGTLGAGGKGYFILDVTDPSNFSEAKAQEVVYIDRTLSNNETRPNCEPKILSEEEKVNCEKIKKDDDIGYITAHPIRDSKNMLETTQIARMNNNRWAAILGNGYNSKNQRPVLLIQFLDGAKELLTIPTTNDAAGIKNAGDNGLSSPALVDLNGDNRVDIVYAGDNLGNMWKFDLTSSENLQWKAAWGLDKPLFTARGPVALSGARSEPQPITAPPIFSANDRSKLKDGGTESVAVGGMMVSFGTGRNLTEDDRSADKTQKIQTLYSILDNTRYKIKDKSLSKDEQRLEIYEEGNLATGIPKPKRVGTMGVNANLAQQQVSSLSADKGYATVRAVDESNNLNTKTWEKFDGWYMDFPESGERLLKPMQFWDGSNILAVYSESPSGTKSSSNTITGESCEPYTVTTLPGSQYRTLINIMDGKRPTVQLVGGDVPLTTSRIEVPMGTPILIKSQNKILDYTGVNPNSSVAKPREDNTMPVQALRPSWRQLK